jgi:aminoglycoside 6-adenylyltransferase
MQRTQLDDITCGYMQLTQQIIDWADQEADVRAALLIGSRARTDHPADAWSDLDVLLFVRDPEPYVRSESWVARLGPVWLTFVERTPDGRAWERRVLYEGGLDVDFALNPAQWLDHLAANGLVPDIADVVRRGVRVLADKDHLLANILQQPIPATVPFHQPTSAEFVAAVSDFWYHSLWSAKHLRRGELWWAKAGCDGKLKSLLQQMLEWHAHAVHGAAHDTWMRGRFLEEWADPRAVAQLATVFAHYDRQDIARALWATMELFRWLVAETAQCWQYTYPAAGDQAVSNLVGRLLAEMQETGSQRAALPGDSTYSAEGAA